ncbi:MAG: beta-ketoacyl synthase N-terminal-like domain-containing protein [Acidobacteriota bacterium]
MAITGMGLITPLGRGVAANWAEVATGRTGLRLEADDGRPLFMRCLGRVVAADPPGDLPPRLAKEAKFVNRGGILGLIAAAEAVAQANLPASVAPADRGLVLATGDLSRVGYEYFYPATRLATGGTFRTLDCEKLNRATMDLVSPFILLESLANNPYSLLTAALGFMGPGTCLAGHSPSGSHALELAFRTVRHGRARAALAVGCGSWLAPIPLLELAGLGVLSKCRRGVTSYRPFDRQRDGFIAGEGGAALLLEAPEEARRRGARVLAMVEGTGNRAEVAGDLRVGAKVTLGAMRAALGEAGVAASELGFLCPHGSGTRRGDRAERSSLATLLGAAAAAVPVCALKPFTGHMGAASDLAEVILGVMAAAHGVVPATLNFSAGDAGREALRIAAHPQPCPRPRFLSASYGAAGQASAVVVAAELGERRDG